MLQFCQVLAAESFPLRFVRTSADAVAQCWRSCMDGSPRVFPWPSLFHAIPQDGVGGVICCRARGVETH